MRTKRDFPTGKLRSRVPTGMILSILFAFHAGGMRLVDVMTLQWTHVDFERKEIRKVYQVSRLLGHASTETTEKVYADYITSTLREKMTDLGFDFLPELGG